MEDLQEMQRIEEMQETDALGEWPEIQQREEQQSPMSEEKKPIEDKLKKGLIGFGQKMNRLVIKLSQIKFAKKRS